MSDIAEVRAALEECANELAEWVENHYKHNTQYPSERRRYERDMEPVKRAREVLAALSRIESDIEEALLIKAQTEAALDELRPALARIEQAGGADGLGPEKQREVWRRALERDGAKRWKLVPVEPTEEMLRRAFPYFVAPSDYSGRNAWGAMLSAVPPPPAAEPEEQL